MGVYSRVIINSSFFNLIIQAFRLVDNFNIRIYSDTINVINVKHCIPFSVFQEHISRLQQC